MAHHHDLIEVHGSHGSLIVHRSSGHIVARYPDDMNDDEYADIRWFDPAALPQDSSTDILYTSFACERGFYTRAMQTGELHDQHGEWFFPFEVELLPAPASETFRLIDVDGREWLITDNRGRAKPDRAYWAQRLHSCTGATVLPGIVGKFFPDQYAMREALGIGEA